MWKLTPLDLPVTPSSYTLESISVNIVQEIPYSLIQTSEQNVGGDMWGLSLDFPTIVDPNVARSVSNFQAQLNGVVNTFKFVMPERDLRYTQTAAVTIQAVVTPTQIYVSGTTVGGTQTVLAGTYIRIRNQLFQILRTQSNFIWDIFPGIRFAGPYIGEPVYYKVNDVYGVFRQSAPTNQHNFNTNHTYNFSLKAMEDTTI